jgi:hypothetical protein
MSWHYWAALGLLAGAWLLLWSVSWIDPNWWWGWLWYGLHPLAWRHDRAAFRRSLAWNQDADAWWARHQQIVDYDDLPPEPDEPDEWTEAELQEVRGDVMAEEAAERAATGTDTFTAWWDGMDGLEREVLLTMFSGMRFRNEQEAWKAGMLEEMAA